MNKTIEQLNQQVKSEEARIEARVSELQQSNLIDQNALNTFVERFAIAVQDEAGEKVLSTIEAQRDAAFKRVEQNNAVINILTSEQNTRVQRMKVEIVKEHLKEINNANKGVAEIVKKLEPHEKAISDVFEKLNSTIQSIIEHKTAINSHNNWLSEADREELGIPDEGLSTFTSLRGRQDPIKQVMVDLIVNIASKAVSQYDLNRFNQFFNQRSR